MTQRDFIVVFQNSVFEGLKNPADADHAKGVQLCGPQRPHAGSAEDRDALIHRPEDFLVPDRRHPFEKPVDQSDRRGPVFAGRKDVSSSGRGA